MPTPSRLRAEIHQARPFRSRRPVDRRITPVGAEPLARIDPVPDQADRTMLASLTSEQLDSLIHLLDLVLTDPGL